MNPRPAEKEQGWFLMFPDRNPQESPKETRRVIQAHLSTGTFVNASLRNALVYL